MANNLFYLPTILVLYFVLQISTPSVANASKLITTYLIHRDSPESPFYDSSLNQDDLVERAINRSITCLSHLNSLIKLPNNYATKITKDYTNVAYGFEYVMEISVGTPPVKQLALIDTASQIVWTQCLPCVNCFNQIQPKFNSMNSWNYQVLACGSKECKALGSDKRCEGENSKCQYNVNYKDNTSSNGDLAIETFKLGRASFKRMVYGCGNNNTGLFDESTAGIVGLGRGPNSLVSMLGDRIGRKFSYCLTSKENTGTQIKFGSNAIGFWCGLICTPWYRSVYTPLFIRKSLMYYFIELEEISLETMRYPLKRVTKIFMSNDKPIENGNILLDLSSTLSYVPRDMYKFLENALRNEIKATPVQHPFFKLCYMDNINPKFPMIIFHFPNDLELKFTMKSTTVQTRGLVCLAILPTDNNDDLGVLGKLLQMDYLIGYDLDNARVYFKPTNCSSNW